MTFICTVDCDIYNLVVCSLTSEICAPRLNTVKGKDDNLSFFKSIVWCLTLSGWLTDSYSVGVVLSTASSITLPQRPRWGQKCAIGSVGPRAVSSSSAGLKGTAIGPAFLLTNVYGHGEIPVRVVSVFE